MKMIQLEFEVGDYRITMDNRYALCSFLIFKKNQPLSAITCTKEDALSIAKAIIDGYNLLEGGSEGEQDN